MTLNRKEKTVETVEPHRYSNLQHLLWYSLYAKERTCHEIPLLLPLHLHVHPNSVRFVCISDTHEKLADLLPRIPPGDVLVHTGDFTNYGDPKAVQEFNELMGSLPHKYKIVIAGNHELGWDETEDLSKRNEYYAGKPGSPGGNKLLTNCIYLQDNSTTVYGINIYGSSWHPLIENPFYRERGASILKEWLKIPTGGEVDVLLTHTPPLGHSDAWYGERWGCAELLNCVEKRVHPKFHVFGHVHEQNGITTNDETIFINASICGHNLDIVNDPILFDIPLPEGQTK
ncbi:calcineurin-like phosphoesterase domain-containing protein [Ditylenchus destructor]|uniref:Calcineurin-like phosphoesterase domain-containing protein n=1 Tax=Ditylenchus destructor TaxID=166010 RepID=A0AAD4R0P4_9BILA|nr:calcineurin-like phosphoesterase domain-containing protein [Ditylenchus destructor]